MIRNAGVAKDEVEDPRPTAELLRQWSSLHPEFVWLPRKFKIAVTGAEHDRAAIKVHDIGLKLKRNEAGDVGYEVIVGGGLGRTPVVGKVIRDFLPREDLLPYMEAIVSVYNLLGRRDNKQADANNRFNKPSYCFYFTFQFERVFLVQDRLRMHPLGCNLQLALG